MQTIKLINYDDADTFGGGKMDISINSITGQLELLDTQEALLQSVLKINLTGQQDNLYGSLVYRAIGTKAGDVPTKAFTYFAIIDCLLYLRRAQLDHCVRRGLDPDGLTQGQAILDQGLRILTLPMAQGLKIGLTFSNREGNVLEASFYVHV